MSLASVSGRTASGGEGPAHVGGFPARCVRFGAFQVDLREQELLRNGSRVRVQGKVYQALVALLEHPGEIVTREALRVHLWPTDARVNYDANVNTTVNKLRQLLGDTDDEAKFVETVPRKGYSFIAKIEYADEIVLAGASETISKAPQVSLWKRTYAAIFLGADRARIWITAGVIALLIGAMLFGAAVTLYSHRII
jgi:DNA-binding winged helix-turn-helix (wHTH) protein